MTLRIASKGALVAILDRAVMSGSNFLVGIVLARSLVPSEYGVFVLLSTTLLVISGIQNALVLGPMRILSVENDPEREHDNIRVQSYLQHALGALTFILTVAAVLLSGFSFLLAFLYGLSVTLYQLQEFARARLFIKFSMRKVLVIDATSQGIRIRLIIIGYFLSILSLPLVYGVACVTLLIGTGGLFSGGERSSLHNIRTTAAHNWKYGQWLLMETLVYSLSVQSYVYMTAHILGAESAAGLGAVQNVFNVFNVIQIGLINFYTPVARRLFIEGSIRQWKRLLIQLGVLLGGTMMLSVGPICYFGEEVLTTLYSPYFAQYHALMPILGLVYCFSGINAVMNMAFRTIEKPQIGFGAKLMSAIGAVICGYPLIKLYGLNGAAIGLVATQVIWVVVYTYSIIRVGRELRPSGQH